MAVLAHRRQHFLRHEEGPAGGDVQPGVEDLDRHVFEKLLIGRKVAPCETRSSSTIMQSPPCSRMALASADALASLRVVSTVKKPSAANFCAMAPPTPQRTPTSTSLSSTGWPCASRVLRPSDCHFDVAPLPTHTCLP